MENETQKTRSALQVRVMSSPKEREAATAYRQKYFFDRVPIQDPYLWTFDREDHIHFMLYQSEKIIGYAHIQCWPNHRAALRIIVIDEPLRGQGFGRFFLLSCEERLKERGVKCLHTESRPDTAQFYTHLGYIEMPFDDPEDGPTDPRDIPMGKKL